MHFRKYFPLKGVNSKKYFPLRDVRCPGKENIFHQRVIYGKYFPLMDI
jgi:hypothetical protein